MQMFAGQRFFYFLRLVIDVVIDYIFGLYYISNRRYILKPKTDLVLESASSLARKIKSKETSSVQVVEAFIARIKEVNDVLNAVVSERFVDALEEAKKIDDDIASGKISEEDFIKKPFLGVPFTTKETTLCKGLKATFGLLSRKDVVAAEDAKVVQLVKEAGGILLGVTNIPQLNRWTETYNPVYGTTNNPYNTSKNVGGSSGGEGCIIAARGSPIGIGTDIGGSLRIPAHRCGIFGHKPTPELIPTAGLTFRDGTAYPTMVSAGPMSAHCEDLLPLFKILLNNKANQLQLDKDVDMKKLNVYYVATSACLLSSPITDEMINLVLKCAQHFNLISDKKPQEVNFLNAQYSYYMWDYMLHQEKDVYITQIMNNVEEAGATVEVFKFLTMQSTFNFYTIMLILSEKLPKTFTEEWLLKTLDELKTEIIEKLGDNGVLLCASEPYPAKYHYTSYFRPYNFSYYCLWSALKFPVTQVPIGLNEDGMPIGIQVVAAPMMDHLTLAVAKELENAFGGYVPPFEMKQ